MESLKEIVPPNKPMELAWPSTDERSFYPRPFDSGLAPELGIEPGHTVLAYHGNVHQANFREVRSLYLAVALLNREGWPTTLLRMGRDHIDLDAGYRNWAAVHAKKCRLRADPRPAGGDSFASGCLRAAGIMRSVQRISVSVEGAGFSGAGTPADFPRTNIGLVTRHGEDAYVLEEANGPAIADAVKTILGDETLRQKLSAGARSFFEANLGWPSTAAKLLGLYRQVLKQRSTSIVPQPTNGELMNLTKRYAETKFAPLSYATVRDYCDSADHLKFLCAMNDLKDVQRPWSAKSADR